MSSLTVAGGRSLRGSVRVPGDKSISHRALLLGALAEGTSLLRGLSGGDDVARTRGAVEALGAVVSGGSGGAVRVTGGRSRLRPPDHPIDVGNSGTSIRLLAGLCATLPGTTVLVGDESVSRRPMDRVAEPLCRMGARLEGAGARLAAPLRVHGGRLKGIDYDLAVPSAQVKSAVLLAGLDADGETVVRERVRTRAHTEEMLAAAGAAIDVDPGGLTVRLRRSVLQAFELDVPGDPSQAAFWVVAACLVPGSEVVLDDVYLGPARDGFLAVLARMGADVERVGPRSLRARHSPGLRATTVPAAEVPGVVDEVPVLAVAAAVAEGTTVFEGLGELRLKESDRVATVAGELAAVGGRVEVSGDSLAVTGPARLKGAPVRSHGDHRMAMAMAVAGLAGLGETRIEGWEAVATSYPGFAEDLARLLSGGESACTP